MREEDCECEFEDVLGPGYPLMRIAMPYCEIHGHPRDCKGCWYCKPNNYPTSDTKEQQ